MEFKRESIRFGVFKSFVGTVPIELRTVFLHTAPLSGVLRCHLVPIVRKNETLMVHITTPSCRNVAQKLVGICRQLGVGIDGYEAHE